MDEATHLVLWRVDERGVAYVALNRPQVYNAYNGDMIAALLVAFDKLAREPLRVQVRSRVRLRPPGIGQRDRKITCQTRPRSPQAAEKRWRRQRLCSVPKVVLGAKINDGIEVIRSASSSRCRLIPLVTNIRR